MPVNVEVAVPWTMMELVAKRLPTVVDPAMSVVPWTDKVAAGVAVPMPTDA